MNFYKIDKLNNVLVNLYKEISNYESALNKIKLSVENYTNTDLIQNSIEILKKFDKNKVWTNETVKAKILITIENLLDNIELSLNDIIEFENLLMENNTKNSDNYLMLLWNGKFKSKDSDKSLKGLAALEKLYMEKKKQTLSLNIYTYLDIDI